MIRHLTKHQKSLMGNYAFSEKHKILKRPYAIKSLQHKRNNLMNSKKQNLQEIKDYLDTHYTEKITLDALAERFYINKFYLTRVFKEQFGQSVTNYLVQLRITQSKRLLRFTDRSIEAVAQECGLNDANYFSRLFKKVEGITPGEYRRQW